MSPVTVSRIVVACLTGGLLGLSAGDVSAGVPACNFCAAPTLSGQPTSAGDRNTTQIYGGVQWTFGQGPELVLGVRAAHTNVNKKSAGAKLEATFPIAGQSIGFDKLRLRLFGGTRTILPELGFGYSFAGGGWLVSGAVQTDYLVVGTDWTTSGQWQPFVGLNTLRRPKAPKAGRGGELACSNPNAQLVAVDSLVVGQNLVAPEDQVNGFTCAEPN